MYVLHIIYSDTYVTQTLEHNKGVEHCLSKLSDQKFVGVSLIKRHNKSFCEISAYLFTKNEQVPVIYLIDCLFYTSMMSDEEAQNTPQISLGTYKHQSAAYLSNFF